MNTSEYPQSLFQRFHGVIKSEEERVEAYLIRTIRMIAQYFVKSISIESDLLSNIADDLNIESLGEILFQSVRKLISLIEEKDIENRQLHDDNRTLLEESQATISRLSEEIKSLKEYQSSRTEMQQDSMNRLADLLREQPGLLERIIHPCDYNRDNDMVDFKGYCQTGRKIDAIKILRVRLNISLKEAKEIVEAWIAQIAPN